METQRRRCDISTVVVQRASNVKHLKSKIRLKTIEKDGMIIPEDEFDNVSYIYLKKM